MSFGGETGIRTLGRLTPSTVFETAPFDHSGTSPRSMRASLVGTVHKSKGVCAPLCRSGGFFVAAAFRTATLR